MTRRLAISILLTVWAMLVAAGVTAYATTRSVLLENLDQSLVRRALAVPGLSRAAGGGETAAAASVEPGDQYLVKNEFDQTIARPAGVADGAADARPLAAFFATADGQRVRSVTVRAYARPAGGHGAIVPVTVTYRGSAQQFDRLLNRLAIALAAGGLLGGLVAAGVAARVSRVALRPLQATAEQIGAIDEQHLACRLDAGRLPVELRPMAARLNELLARLEAAFDARNRFLADASHELRTPVAALVTALEVSLRRPRTAEAYRATLETCRDDAVMLRHLVERLMEQVRSQTPGPDEPPESVDVARLLGACVAGVAPLAEAKRVTIGCACVGPLTFVTWPHRLRSVVTNLLSNAIEYNRPGGTVHVSCEADGGHLRLHVRDTGIGIVAEHLPRLFEPFYRADAARRHEAGHLGLGLHLVQTHSRTMGGTCGVESEPGVGTTFTVILPSPTGDRLSDPARPAAAEISRA